MTTYNMDGTLLGGDSSHQLVDLLAIVSNADVYASKLQALQDLISARNKLLDKVGPAEDILKLRDETKNLRDEAEKKALDKISAAEAKASERLSSAEQKAKQMLADAKKQEKELVEKATALKNQAEADSAAAKSALRAAEQTKASVDKVISDYAARSKVLANSQAEADELKLSLQNTKDAIIAKHQAFIASL